MFVLLLSSMVYFIVELFEYCDVLFIQIWVPLSLILVIEWKGYGITVYSSMLVTQWRRFCQQVFLLIDGGSFCHGCSSYYCGKLDVMWALLYWMITLDIWVSCECLHWFWSIVGNYSSPLSTGAIPVRHGGVRVPHLPLFLTLGLPVLYSWISLEL